MSRTHASIDIVGCDFYITDLQSKFGSHMLLKNELLVMPDKAVSFQVSRIFVDLKLNKQLCAWLTCFQ